MNVGEMQGLRSNLFCYLIFQSNLEGALSRPRHFLATKSSLKIMKTAFYFTLNALFVRMIFKFLS